MEETIENYLLPALNKIVSSYDFDFARGQSSITVESGVSTYKLRGHADDCRDIISLWYDGDDDPLPYKRPADSDRDVGRYNPNGVSWWTDYHRTDDFPVVKLVAAPDQSATLIYSYRRSNLTVDVFPDGWIHVLVGGVVDELVGGYRKFRNDLDQMKGYYKGSRRQSQPMPMGEMWEKMNRERNRTYGY